LAQRPPSSQTGGLKRRGQRVEGSRGDCGINDVLLGGTGGCRHGAYEDAENQCKTRYFQLISPYFIDFLDFLVLCCTLARLLY
jgi:hypothetical protein